MTHSTLWKSGHVQPSRILSDTFAKTSSAHYPRSVCSGVSGDITAVLVPQIYLSEYAAKNVVSNPVHSRPSNSNHSYLYSRLSSTRVHISAFSVKRRFASFRGPSGFSSEILAHPARLLTLLSTPRISRPVLRNSLCLCQLAFGSSFDPCLTLPCKCHITRGAISEEPGAKRPTPIDGLLQLGFSGIK